MYGVEYQMSVNQVSNIQYSAPIMYCYLRVAR